MFIIFNEYFSKFKLTTRLLEKYLAPDFCLILGPVITFVSFDITCDVFTVFVVEVVKLVVKFSGVVGGVSILFVNLFVSSPLHINLKEKLAY